jgi:hypothetical protein
VRAFCAGRFEFLEYFPEKTQGVLVQPIGTEGVLVAATDTQRGFSRLDQAIIFAHHITDPLRAAHCYTHSLPTCPNADKARPSCGD